MSLRPTDIGLPYPEYRPGQEQSIYKIMSSRTRFTEFQAPTGVGKSIIYVSLAKIVSGRTLILVINRGLQDQLAEFDRAGMVDIRGHNNYRCADGDSRDEFECLADRGACEFRNQLRRAKQAQIVRSNIALWTTLQTIGGEAADALGTFDNLVIDEAHAVPLMLTDQLGVKFGWREYERYLRVTLCEVEELGSQTEWARSMLAKIDKAAAHSVRAKLALRRMKRTLSRLLIDADSTWLVRRIDGDTYINPIWPWLTAERYLFAGIRRVLLTSAFIPLTTASRLGIQQHEITRINADSPFDPARSPFYYWPVAKVGYNMTNAERFTWLAAIDQIIAKRLNVKGIIHSRSYAYAEWIVKHSQAKSIMITHGPGGITRALAQYLDTPPPCYLVTPAAVEGIDLPHDACRVNIIGKVSYSDQRERMNAARNRVDPKWRVEEIVQKIVQAHGRGMRVSDDYCETFMLDGYWGDFRKRAHFPEYFVRTWRDINKAPQPLSALYGSH